MYNYPTYKEFLVEDRRRNTEDNYSRSSELTEDAFWDLYNKEYKVKKGFVLLYRILMNKQKGSFYHTNPKNKYILERDEKNQFFCLIDNCPTWKNYPKRTKSIFTLTDFNEALTMHGGYNSRIFVAFPKKDIKLAICSYNDFFKCIDYAADKKINNSDNQDVTFNINYCLETLSDSILKKSIENYNQNPIAFKKWIDLINKEINNITDIEKKKIIDNVASECYTPIGSYFVNDFLNNTHNIVKSFENIFNPITLDVDIKKHSDIPNNKIAEVYFDDECLLVDYNYFRQNEERFYD